MAQFAAASEEFGRSLRVADRAAGTSLVPGEARDWKQSHRNRDLPRLAWLQKLRSGSAARGRQAISGRPFAPRGVFESMPFVRKRAPSVERSPHRKQGSKFFFAGKARRQATQELLDISKSRLNRLLPSHAKGATASETNLDMLSDAEVRELAAQISSRETST